MSAQAPARSGQQPVPGQVAEYAAWSAPGVRVLVGGIVTLLAAIALLILSALQSPGAARIALLVIAIVLLIAGELSLHGLTSVVAGEARVVQLFGRYRGTIRAPGLHWVNPLARRRRVSVRILCSEQATQPVVNTGSLYQ